LKLPLLLDTCAAIWIAEDGGLSQFAIDEINDAQAMTQPIYISPISAWEIGMLLSRGRLSSPLDPLVWFGRLLEQGISLAELAPDVLIASSFLPGDPPLDPADRIIIATAREAGFRIMTRDKEIVEYAENGHANVVIC